MKTINREPLQRNAPLGLISWIIAAFVCMPALVYCAEGARLKQARVRIHYDTTMWKMVDTSVAQPRFFQEVYHLPPDQELSSSQEFGDIVFAVRMVATFAGKVGRVHLVPIHTWSGVHEEDSAWSVAKSRVTQMLYASLLHDVTSTEYSGPISIAFLSARYEGIFSTREGIAAVKNDLIAEHVFFVRIGVGHRYLPGDHMNIGLFFD